MTTKQTQKIQQAEAISTELLEIMSRCGYSKMTTTSALAVLRIRANKSGLQLPKTKAGFVSLMTQAGWSFETKQHWRNTQRSMWRTRVSVEYITL